MNLSISTDTWIFLSIIAVAFVCCFVFVFRHKNTEKLVATRRGGGFHWFPRLVYWVHFGESPKA